MRQFLGKQGVEAEDATDPVVLNYLTAVFIPSTRGTLTARNENELKVLGTAIDAILRGDLSRATDTLVQQLKSVEQVHHDGGSWKAARHLNTVGTGRVSALDDEEQDRLYRDERADLRSQKLAAEAQGKSRRGDADR